MWAEEQKERDGKRGGQKQARAQAQAGGSEERESELTAPRFPEHDDVFRGDGVVDDLLSGGHVEKMSLDVGVWESGKESDAFRVDGFEKISFGDW